MKNYDAYCAGIFPVDLKEVEKLPRDHKFSEKLYAQNLLKVKAAYGEDIVEFTMKTLPKHLKRGSHDSATLLVFRRISGNYYAKRFNNSQHINLDQ